MEAGNGIRRSGKPAPHPMGRTGPRIRDKSKKGDTIKMTSSLVHRKFSGLLLLVGSCVFVYGGAFHPHINSSIGVLGSAEFFENFRMKIAHHSSWEQIHAMILARFGLLACHGILYDRRQHWHSCF